MDELLEYAPSFIKRRLWRYFDFKKVELPVVEVSVNEAVFSSCKRKKFSEIKDALSKEKSNQINFNYEWCIQIVKIF